MFDTSHNSMEREVLLLLQRLHAEDGFVTREKLTVVGRGRGLEVARSLLQLKSMGLVEVAERRPSFWRRIFGARTIEVLVPVVQPAPEQDAVIPPEALAGIELVEPVQELAAPQPEILEAPVQPAAYEPPAPEPVYVPEVVAPAPVIEEPVIVAPEPQPVVPAAPVVPVAPPMPRRPTPVGYTDELGGAPAEFNLAPALDPALVEGMRDFLSEIGLELTFAGEALAAHRLQSGLPVGDVVMQIVVYALAHAAHHETISGPIAPQEDLKDYAVAILEELRRLTEAGEISRDAFASQGELIRQLTDRSVDRSATVAQLLSDPVGGAAPPALLPEELRGVEVALDDVFQDT